jgi:hypothetical protein
MENQIMQQSRTNLLLLVCLLGAGRLANAATNLQCHQPSHLSACSINGKVVEKKCLNTGCGFNTATNNTGQKVCIVQCEPLNSPVGPSLTSAVWKPSTKSLMAFKDKENFSSNLKETLLKSKDEAAFRKAIDKARKAKVKIFLTSEEAFDVKDKLKAWGLEPNEASDVLVFEK